MTSSFAGVSITIPHSIGFGLLPRSPEGGAQ